MSYPRSGDEEAKAITQKMLERESIGRGNKKTGNYRKLPHTEMMLTKLKPNLKQEHSPCLAEQQKDDQFR